ncbi:MAG: CHRD domain-containing protein [Janthinobacterium lividum]
MRINLVLAGLAALAVSACSAPMTFQGPMTAAYEVPPTNSQGVGTIVAVVYPSTRAMTYTAEYKNLTGPATAAHFHGPAAPGANAPVVIPSTVTPATIRGGATLTPAQLADLQAGKYYYNIHTATNPGGEIRGQLVRAQ